MVKKKISGQTITIIVLSVLLVVAITFGGVYAFYSARTSKLSSGRIVMGNVTIHLESGLGSSGKSEVVISNSTNMIPGQNLENSPLIVKNNSSVPIYLIVVYKLEAYKLTFINGSYIPVMDKDGEYVKGDLVEDYYYDQVIDVGAEYINTVNPGGNCADISPETAAGWVDYVFKGINDSGVEEYYRCLVLTTAVEDNPKVEGDEKITVIEEKGFKLSNGMGDDYQSTHIVFTFQAFAIGAAAFENEISNSTERADICSIVVNAIYESQGKTFLTVGTRG